MNTKAMSTRAARKASAKFLESAMNDPDPILKWIDALRERLTYQRGARYEQLLHMARRFSQDQIQNSLFVTEPLKIAPELLKALVKQELDYQVSIILYMILQWLGEKGCSLLFQSESFRRDLPSLAILAQRRHWLLWSHVFKGIPDDDPHNELNALLDGSTCMKYLSEPDLVRWIQRFPKTDLEREMKSLGGWWDPEFPHSSSSVNLLRITFQTLLPSYVRSVKMVLSMLWNGQILFMPSELVTITGHYFSSLWK
jgi:hypothetical protein